MHTPTLSTFDLDSKRRTRVSSTKHEAYDLELCEETAHGLRFRAADIEGQDWRVMEALVFPKLGLQVARFEWLEGASYAYDYYLDIVRVQETGERWQVLDLYLDILLFERRKLRLKDTDQYLEALAEGKLESSDAEYALSVMHEVANGLAEHDYVLSAYLKHQGLGSPW